MRMERRGVKKRNDDKKVGRDNPCMHDQPKKKGLVYYTILYTDTHTHTLFIYPKLP